jgi:hypothetical protein
MTPPCHTSPPNMPISKQDPGSGKARTRYVEPVLAAYRE